MESPPGERLAFLERECPDADLRREVEALLQHTGTGLPVLERAIASAASVTQDGTPPGWRLARASVPGAWRAGTFALTVEREVFESTLQLYTLYMKS